MYHALYFKEQESRWTYSGVEYVFDPRKRLALNRALQHRSIRYSSSELHKSSGTVTHIPIPVRMSPAQIERYETLLRDAKEARENDEHPGNVFTRARQTTAGFIALRGEETGPLEISFSPNPKADALEAVLGQLGEDLKIVVFHSFVHTGTIIRERLDKLKIRYSGVGRGFKNPGLQLDRFLTDPKCRVFVANCQAGGTGVDGLQKVCHYALFYESPTPPSLRVQAEARLNRPGQNKPVFIYDLIAEGISIDRRVLAAIKQGQDLFTAIVEGKESL
jgi:SNF2 family DNA or RNA helicase